MYNHKILPKIERIFLIIPNLVTLMRYFDYK